MKRIVICADGTWNSRDQVDEKTKKRRPTNVTKVARAIKPRSSNNIDQLVVYHEGVGTSGGMDKYTGGAFGDGIEKNIRELYRSILYNYEDGDELYFFGFSRGAFTVRTLAGFMNKVGLLHKGDDYYLPEVYAWYESGNPKGSKEWDHAFHNVKDPRECPPIRFIGVWDTVGSLGPPGILGQVFNKGKYKYHDIELNQHIENAYQALAIDERRKPFAPSIWTRRPGFNGALKQAWFVGVHSDVGGSQARDGLANEALHWIVEKAEKLGVEFDNAFLAHYTPCFNGDLHESMTAMYKVMGEYRRPIGQHLAAGEELHQSVLDRQKMKELGYNPANLQSRPQAITVCNTTRILRGEPCPALPHA